MHSGTKYFAAKANSDLICGIAAIGRQNLIETVSTRTTLGGAVDPRAGGSSCANQRLEPYAYSGRMTMPCESLSFSRSILKCAVCGIFSPKAMPSARAGNGADARRRRCFELRGRRRWRRRQAFFKALDTFSLAPSLGGVDSLVTIPGAHIARHDIGRGHGEEENGCD